MTQIQLQWVNLIHEENRGEVHLPLPINIGRALSNDLVLEANEAGVSRWHACVIREDGQVVVIDQHSTNGVFIGSDRISKAVVSSGTTFRVGAFDITLTLQHRCANSACRQLVDVQQQMCPWCGRFLADAITQDNLLQ